MNLQPKNINEHSATRAIRSVTLLSVMLIAACGGSGDGVSIGTGQDSDPVVIDFPIAYVRAPLPVDDQGEFAQSDLRELVCQHPRPPGEAL